MLCKSHFQAAETRWFTINIRKDLLKKPIDEKRRNTD